MIITKTPIELVTLSFNVKELTEDQYTEFAERLNIRIEGIVFCGDWWDGLREDGKGCLILDTPIDKELAERVEKEAAEILAGVLLAFPE